MKTLVVYYSFEGNTRLIAHAIAGAIGADLLELKPKKEIGTHGFMKYVWGGRQVVLKRKTASRRRQTQDAGKDAREPARE